MERILLFGGSGILGTEVLGLLQQGKIDYVAPRSTDLDIRNENLVRGMVRVFKPTWIINCAAWTNVDGAEESFEEAREINETAVKKIGTVADSLNCKVIHISTDYVFDGKSSEAYLENSLVNPINKYGESKLNGENALLNSLSSAYVVRSSWLYGVSGHNFVKTIARKALQNESAFVVDDQVGSPTSSRDLAAAILSIVRNQPEPGIYNYSNDGSCSWFELAKAVYENIGTETRLVSAIDTESLRLMAKRPKFSLLSKDKWNAAHLGIVPKWRASLNLLLPEIVAELQRVEKI